MSSDYIDQANVTAVNFALRTIFGEKPPSAGPAQPAKPFIFRESANYHGKPARRRRTFVVLEQVNGALAFGVAMCSPRDQFSKKRGVQIAEGRALRALSSPSNERSWFWTPEQNSITKSGTRAAKATWLLHFLRNNQGFRWEPKETPCNSQPPKSNE